MQKTEDPFSLGVALNVWGRDPVTTIFLFEDAAADAAAMVPFEPMHGDDGAMVMFEDAAAMVPFNQNDDGAEAIVPFNQNDDLLVAQGLAVAPEAANLGGAGRARGRARRGRGRGNSARQAFMTHVPDAPRNHSSNPMKTSESVEMTISGEHVHVKHSKVTFKRGADGRRHGMLTTTVRWSQKRSVAPVRHR